jgi:hypothetical protein
MSFEQQRTTVERDVVQPAPVDPVLAASPPAYSGRVVEQRDATVYRPSGSTVASRVVVAIFGIIQALILVRLVLLLLDAREGNDLVAAILGASQVFVAPFEGMFGVDALKAGGSVLDVAAITALVALTILELVILAILRIPRRSEAV